MNPGRFTLEVCIATVDDALAARDGGADRLELNAALEVGGLTPSPGTLREVLRAVNLPVIAMARPRPGGFCDSDADFRTLQADIDWMLSEGAAGIAVGVLDAAGRIDIPRCRAIRSQVETADLVFHRAFDLTPDPIEALEQLVDLGYNRILTSGQKPTAFAGVDVLRHLNAQAAGRIGLVAGGGMGGGVLGPILTRSGLREIHGSFREPVPEPTMQTVSSLPFGDAFGAPGGFRLATSSAVVRSVRDRLDALFTSPDGSTSSGVPKGLPFVV